MLTSLPVTRKVRHLLQYIGTKGANTRVVVGTKRSAIWVTPSADDVDGDGDLHRHRQQRRAFRVAERTQRRQDPAVVAQRRRSATISTTAAVRIAEQCRQQQRQDVPSAAVASAAVASIFVASGCHISARALSREERNARAARDVAVQPQPTRLQHLLPKPAHFADRAQAKRAQSQVLHASGDLFLRSAVHVSVLFPIPTRAL